MAVHLASWRVFQMKMKKETDSYIHVWKEETFLAFKIFFWMSSELKYLQYSEQMATS